MKTVDFEKAIEALSVNELEVTKYSYGINGQVVAVYAKMGERTLLKWDYCGRSFCLDIDEEIDVDGQAIVPEVNHPEYLDYRRDADFDLKFD